MNKRMRLSFIGLILKKEGDKELGEYRPISLLNNLYKIIAKVLPLQLRRVMGSLVSSTQSAFIQGM